MTDEWYVILNMNCKYEICRRCPKSGLFKGSLKECDDWIKQKQKDEIKDKISMALKDPILQQGFEIICKENAELDCQMNRNKYCHSCVNATDKCFRKEIGCPCEKYKSYKDENAELKEKVSYLEDNLRVARKDRENLQLDVAKGLKEFVKDYPATSLRYLANEKYVEQLTKAKELIEELSSSLSVVGECDDEECELLNRAEQFLKDSEVEK